MARQNGPSVKASLNRLYKDYIGRSKKRNFFFDLTLEEFRILTSQNCHYCGVEPHQERRNYVYNGLDRKDNTMGYFRSNCVPCCGACNTMKSNKLTYREMVEVSRVLKKMRG